MTDRSHAWLPRIFLAAVFVLSLALKLGVIHVGSPFVTIDDRSTFEGGFLVWFGNAPPQRMYLECWVSGLVSLVTYVLRVLTHAAPGPLGMNLVADAYRDFTLAPDPYAHAYRYLVLMMDMAAAALVYVLSRKALGRSWRGWAAALPAALFLLSYNTIWADLVARPDAQLPLFMMAGLLMYYRSDFGRHPGWLLGAGFVLGLGAGLKLHLAFGIAFLLADLMRVHGLRGGMRLGWGFMAMAVLAFCLSAGTPLFDPLKYVKLRLTNAKDDASPWLKWGHEFIAMLRGTGWIILPFTLGAVLQKGRNQFRRFNPVAASLTFQAIGWLLLFASIRQLRAYWMLPALPLFYVIAVGFLVSLGNWRPSLHKVGAGALVVALAIMSGQSSREMNRFRSFDYNGLRRWVTENVGPGEPFFVFGHEGLTLPRNTECLERIAAGLERGLGADRSAGQSFTERHLKNWEEETGLVLADLLNRSSRSGHEYYSYYSMPFDKYEGLIDMSHMRYVMVERGFVNPPDFPLETYLARDFEQVSEVGAAGGGGYGLTYRVFARKVHDVR